MPPKRPDGDSDAITVKQTRPPSGFHDAVTKGGGGKRTNSRRKTPEAGVDAYLAKVPEELRAALVRVREIVRSLAPTATEDLVIQVPTFVYHGPLIAYAAVRGHCSFFVRSVALMKTMEKELAPYVAGPGTLRFTHMQPLPLTLLKAIVEARMRENEAAAGVSG